MAGGSGLVKRAAVVASAARRRAHRIAATAAGCNRYYLWRAAGAAVGVSTALWSCSLVAALLPVRIRLPLAARPPVRCQLMSQDQNASCKLGAAPTKIAQPRYLSGATTNPPARGRVVEVTADPQSALICESESIAANSPPRGLFEILAVAQP